MREVDFAAVRDFVAATVPAYYKLVVSCACCAEQGCLSLASTAMVEEFEVVLFDDEL